MENKKFISRFTSAVLSGLLLVGSLPHTFVNVKAEMTLPNGQMPMKNIFNAKMHGEIKITGNTLHMPDKRYYNNAYITSYGNSGAGGSSSDKSEVACEPQNPDFTFTKKHDKPADYKPVAGEVITYTFTVTNTGNVTLENVTVEDPMHGRSTITLNKTTLLPGEEATATATYTITQTDVKAGKLENSAKISGMPPQIGENPSTPVADTDSVVIYLPPADPVIITPPQTDKVPPTPTYEYKPVTKTGETDNLFADKLMALAALVLGVTLLRLKRKAGDKCWLTADKFCVKANLQ